MAFARHDPDTDETETADRSGQSGQSALVSKPFCEPPSRVRAPSNAGRTLLPSPIATAVSLATRSTGFALRVGTLLGGYGFATAKVTTLSSLELGRGILEGILSRAGKDVIANSGSELGRADAETILERSLESLHRTMAQVVFWTTTGFHMTGATLSTVSDVSQLLLTSLDQFFGSTDSSRAIASIITLIRREFQNPATGMPGERVGVVDLVLALCGLAYLQRRCHRMIEAESQRLQIDELVWDVVVLSDGERIDVHEASLYGAHAGSYAEGGALSIDNSTSQKIMSGMRSRQLNESDSGDDSLPEIALKKQIISALPPDAKVSITTSVQTVKTITVDISGSDSLPMLPPPGVELVEHSRQRIAGSKSHNSIAEQASKASYRVVYQVKQSTERITDIHGEEETERPSGFVEVLNDDDSPVVDADEAGSPPPPPPPKSPVEAKSLTTQLTAQKRPASPRTSASTYPTKSRQPLSAQNAQNAANQKRPRQASPPTGKPAVLSRKQSSSGVLPESSKADISQAKKAQEKKGGLRTAFRKGPLSGFIPKEDSGSESSGGSKGKRRPAQTVAFTAKPKQSLQKRPSPPSTPRLGVPGRASSLIPRREPPHGFAIEGYPGPTKNPSVAQLDYEPFQRSSSRASFVSVHERRRDSVTSQIDTYSIHTSEAGRCITPTLLRAEVVSGGGGGGPVAKSRSSRDMLEPPRSPEASHFRRKPGHGYTPSIYTLQTNASVASLVPYNYHQRSAFSGSGAISTLRLDGTVDGMFPSFHLLRNLDRYMRYASASYGSNFLRVMGIAKEMPTVRALDDTHHELRSFAHHTHSETDSILLSSFVDPQGGSDGTGSTNTGIPLVHYISLDHESKAVVLVCRGTLGFEDVLADMTCDYDDLAWRGSTYKVHKGVHASARRLLYGGDGRVLITLRQALDEFEDYGLVLAGHSLGGAVTALLGVMLSEPVSRDGTFFVTSPQPHSRLLSDGSAAAAATAAAGEHAQISLPSGRPIHVYAFGPPSTMSASLCRETRGLVTSVVHGRDLVPYLSLGVLHDFQALALAFKSDNNEAKVEVRQRIWDGLRSGLASRWYGASSSSGSSSSSLPPPSAESKEAEDERWAYAALKVLRASMLSTKLMPPGEVFALESTRVLRRDAFVGRDSGSGSGSSGGGGGGSSSSAALDHIGRPARRLVLKYVKDVELRFREVRFGTSMLTDHSPGRYEAALAQLRSGVMQS